MADTRADKWFDISYVLCKFNNNPKLTFEEIAREYGMSEEELEERMKRQAGDDEKDRVKKAWSQNKRRKRMKAKKTEQASQAEKPTQEEEETTMKEAEVQEKSQSMLDLKRQELAQKIEAAEEELNRSKAEADSLQSGAEQKQQAIADLRTQFDKKSARIQDLEETLAKAKETLADLTAKLDAAKQIADNESAQLEVALARVDKNQELLNALKAELEGLDDFVVNLIDPNYDLTDRAPTTGRLISTVDFGGLVEAEMSDSDIDDVSFSKLLNICRKTGFESIVELGNAYEFAWLVIKYKTDPQYEVSVVTDDARVVKLIDMLME